MTETKKNLLNYTREQLKDLMEEMGEKPYRSIQLFDWIYKRQVYNFDEMTDISKKFREVLKEKFEIKMPKIFTRQDAGDGTIKLLLEMDDGSKVETVLMRYNYGNAVCVSSEVGCNMGCAFCASGLLKKTRDLTTAEMMGEVLAIDNILKEQGENVTHIVVMGTGEPFDNYDNVLGFVKNCNDPKCLEIGARHITVSTCGLTEGIRKYANEGIQINLAISLHAPNDEIRNQIMPISRRYDMEKLMDAIRYYEKKANRRVTFEYILLAGLNDSVDNAHELADLIKGINSYVNLIPYNPVAEKPFKRSSDKQIQKFYDTLKRRGVNCTIRKEFGTDIDAACGQLRVKYERKRK